MPNGMFRNDGGRRFQDVTTAGGFGHLQKGHGVAFADLDQDGDQDVFEQMGGAYRGHEPTARSTRIRTPGRHRRARLGEPGARRHGRQPRRDRGARHGAPADAGRTARVHRVVGTGGSFGASALRVLVGMGDATCDHRCRGRLARRRTERARDRQSQIFPRASSPERHYLLKQGAAGSGAADASGGGVTLTAGTCALPATTAHCSRTAGHQGTSVNAAVRVTVSLPSDTVTRNSQGPVPTSSRGSSLACCTRPVSSAGGTVRPFVAIACPPWSSSTRPVRGRFGAGGIKEHQRSALRAHDRRPEVRIDQRRPEIERVAWILLIGRHRLGVIDQHDVADRGAEPSRLLIASGSVPVPACPLSSS